MTTTTTTTTTTTKDDEEEEKEKDASARAMPSVRMVREIDRGARDGEARSSRERASVVRRWKLTRATRSIARVRTARPVAMSRDDLAPDVLLALAQTVAEDALSGNYDLARPQRIAFVGGGLGGLGGLRAFSSLVGALVALTLTALTVVVAVVVAIGGYAYANRRTFVAKLDAWAKARALGELERRTTATCALQSCAVRWNTVTLRGLTIGNAMVDGVTFASPHLASFEEIKIAIDFLSALGRLQFGNLVFGFVTTKCDEIYVSGASVFIEELGRAKNFKIMRQRREEEAKTAEEEATAREETPADADVDGGFFGSFSSSLAATQKAIDAQMQEAMKLPGAVAGSLKNAGADVTKRLYALADILEKLKRPSPIDHEEEKHLDRATLRRAPMVLRVNNLTFYNWSLTITTVASTPFQFQQFQMNNFIGKPRELAKDVGIGLVTEIMNEFHRKIFGGVTDGITSLGTGIMGAGSTIVGGVGTGVSAVGSGILGAGSTIVSGVTSGIGGMASGVSSVGASIGRGFSSQ